MPVNNPHPGTSIERRALRRIEAPSALTRRSLTIGITLVAFVAGFAPYNDYVLHNSPFIGNHFPIGIVTLVVGIILVWNPLLHLLKNLPALIDMFILALIVAAIAGLLYSTQAFLHLFRQFGLYDPGPFLLSLRGNFAFALAFVGIAFSIPWFRQHLAALRSPLSTGELVVIMTLMLVAASVPSSGLMRYLEPMIVSPYYFVRQYPWLKPIADLMPSWLVPSKDPNSSIVNNYWLGIDPVRGETIPIAAFLLPQILWAFLIAAILGSALFLAAIFRKQWVFHERLTFPLATIPLELMAAPEPGRWYNRLWRNPLLWAGTAIPVFVYLLAGLHQQFPAIPFIGLSYDFHDAFTERPWNALPYYLTSARIYLSVVGVCFFVPSEIAFSLWFFLLLNGLSQVFFARYGIDPRQNEATRAMGTYVGYFAGLLWLARGHLRNIVHAAWHNQPRDEAEPLSSRTMVLGWLICTAVAWIWLMLVGMNPLLALLLLAIGTMLVTLMARIAAETGIFFLGAMWNPHQFVGALLGPRLVNALNFQWTQVISRIFYADLRETLMPYAVNSMRMSQEIRVDQRPRWFRWLAGAVLVSTVISGASNHYLSYTRGRTAIPDDYASRQMPYDAMQETYRFIHTVPETSVAASWTHFAIGLGMVVVAMVGRVLWVGWPFHPIGLVLMNSGPLCQFGFSVFLGWCVKRLLLRYGGAAAFRRARPFFIGLIIGEIVSAGVWMFIGLCTNGAVSFTLFPR